MSQKDEDIESLLALGLIGAALGALLSKNKGTGAILGGIAGAAISASLKASEDAKQTGIPLIIEENNALYKVYPDGTKEFIKDLPQSTTKLPKKFKLR